MKLQRVYEFLQNLPRYKESGDGAQCTVRCPFCGDSQKSEDHGHFSIKLEVGTTEPMVFQCFRADCGEKGILKTSTLQMLGCTDMATIMELSMHNAGISGSIDKDFVEKKAREYALVNLNEPYNQEKLNYINYRLGTKFETGDLRDYKIQLGLYEFLRINSIKQRSFNQRTCDMLDANCIGFMSMYNDYLICRDCTPEMVTGRRYHMYRTSGKPNPADTKLYCIPTELDLLDPEPADINVAEGTFSILGAYLHTKAGKDHRNSVWAANCGTGYLNTIIHLSKQYGLLDTVIHIWSDSEIGIKKYESLYKDLRKRINIMDFYVHYNRKAEDFGHPKSEIKVDTVSIMRR